MTHMLLQILKLYAWEPSFIKKVNDARSKELDIEWKAAFWDTAMHFYWSVAPYMVRWWCVWALGK